ncbi:cardiolipin synthase [Luteibacter rhizovicinus]|uniref:Cardiolipin synthase n=1 Tax=Luteibacter rhizovicinus TaxID=242606 RepID=A0A4R3YSL6_9GAMM|nr:cardiolipin synthase [Luteibacter rhizovicinus]TCV95897.1 cardiolipin synthase [Luteibacter rhizovicinus]
MWLTIIAFAALGLHAAGVLAAMHAVMHARTAQGAFAWALGLVLLPYVTLVPYLFLGESHFSGYVDLHRQRQERRFVLCNGTEWPDRGAYLKRHAVANDERYSAIGNMLKTGMHGGHALTLLIDGEAAFASMFEAIARAEHYVLLQFFIIHDDELGRRLQTALLERAAAGIPVCVLYDSIGSHDLPRHYVARLRESGVQVHPFATRRWRNRFQLNFRNHRKVLVVDGYCGFVGGLNAGDEYLGLKPPLAPWRDTHIRIEGPAVADLYRSFAEDWDWVTGEQPPFRPPHEHCGNAQTMIVATGPADRQESCSLFFTQAIHAARERVWITTPYFVPDQSVFSALRLAAFRGVDVRVLIPCRPDHRTVFMASTLYAHEATLCGVRVFRYRPGFIHQKVMLIDSDTAVVGSMNLDNRSFRLNFEIASLNVDEAFAAEVEKMLTEDFANADEVNPEEYRRLPYLKRVALQVARMFDPVL